MVAYCLREDVKAALDVQETARQNARIDAAIESSARRLEAPGVLNQILYPETLTQTFDWPDYDYGRRGYLLRFRGKRQLISATTITSGGTVIAATSGYILRPDDGPPYNRLEINLGGTASLSSAATTWQRSVSILGLWGDSDVQAPAGTLAAIVSSTTATTITCSSAAAVGVGSILKIDSERLVVTDKASVTTGQTLAADIAGQTSVVSVGVQSGAALAVGETITLDSERMLIEDITGNTLTVRRAYDGSVLAAHTTGATVYAPRTLTVTRGALGSTAATHLNGATITTWLCPALVRAANKALALSQLNQESAGYARKIGVGQAERSADPHGLDEILAAVREAYGRRRFHGGAI